MRNGNELKQQILNEIATGATAKQCAEKYNIPAGTIRSWVCREKLNRNVAGKKPATKNAAQRKNATEKKATTKTKEPVITLEDVDKELTEMQRLFCWYYIRNFNATQAAIKAGYSVKTAYQYGYQLLQNPSVRREIERLKKIRSEAIMLTEDDIVERYMRIAFADMTDFVTFGKKEAPILTENGVIINEETGKPYIEEISYLDFNDHAAVDGGLICEISKSRHGIKIKLEDRQKALEFLAKYFKMNPEHKHKQWYDTEKLKIQREELELKKKESEMKAW